MPSIRSPPFGFPLSYFTFIVFFRKEEILS